jgi:hypothetical protein
MGPRGAAIVLAGCAWVASASVLVAAEQAPAVAGESASQESDLAEKTQNPVSDLVSVPFQENLDYGVGAFDRARSTLNIQPVVPAHLFGGWNLVTRVIAPIAYAPDATAMTGGSSGLGDINPTFFVTAANPGPLILGVGPAFLLPTATQRGLGAGKWCAGPAVVVLVQPKPWTIGVLASNVWSFAGEGDRASVDQLSLQYFLNYNFRGGVYLTSAPILSADLNAPSGNRWLVPVGGGVGKIFKLLGKLPLNGSVAAYGNVVKPPGGPDWQLRLQLAFLFPR